MPRKRRPRAQTFGLPAPPNLNPILSELRGLSQYEPLTPNAIDDRVNQQVRATIDPVVNQINTQRARATQSFQVQSQEAQGWQTALMNILGGGQSGEAGMAHAREQFGGSYLAGVAATEGLKLLAQISRDFNQTDWELAGQLSEAMGQEPALRIQLRQQITEEDTAHSERSFQNRLAIAGLVLEDWKNKLTVAQQREAFRMARRQLRLQEYETVAQVGQGNQRLSLQERRDRISERQANERIRVQWANVRLSGRRAGVTERQYQLAVQRERRMARQGRQGGGEIPARDAAMAEAMQNVAGLRGDLFTDEFGRTVRRPGMTDVEAIRLAYAEVGPELHNHGYSEKQIKAQIFRQLQNMGFIRRKAKKPKRNRPNRPQR